MLDLLAEQEFAQVGERVTLTLVVSEIKLSCSVALLSVCDSGDSG